MGTKRQHRPTQGQEKVGLCDGKVALCMITRFIMYAMSEKETSVKLCFGLERAVEGGAFCVTPYATETAVAGIAPYGLPVGGVYVSSEKMMEAALLSGYTVTSSNMLVNMNDMTTGITGENMVRELMGEEN